MAGAAHLELARLTSQLADRFDNLEGRSAPADVSEGEQPAVGVGRHRAAELGVGGFLLFLAYLAIAFQRLTVARREELGPPGLASAARTSLIVAAVAALTLSEQYFAPFWLLGALGTALWGERARAA